MCQAPAVCHTPFLGKGAAVQASHVLSKVTGYPCDSNKEGALTVSQVPGARLYISQAVTLASAKVLRQELPGLWEEQIESWCG